MLHDIKSTMENDGRAPKMENSATNNVYMMGGITYQSPQGLKSSKIKILKKNLRESNKCVSISMSVRLVQCPSI